MWGESGVHSSWRQVGGVWYCKKLVSQCQENCYLRGNRRRADRKCSRKLSECRARLPDVKIPFSGTFGWLQHMFYFRENDSMVRWFSSHVLLYRMSTNFFRQETIYSCIEYQCFYFFLCLRFWFYFSSSFSSVVPFMLLILFNPVKIDIWNNKNSDRAKFLWRPWVHQ